MGKKVIILIDGHALAFRSFFALERTNMHTTDNIPTWAVYGFFKSMFDLLKNHDIDPNAIAVAFDVSRKTFRLEKYPNYKANRETMPDSLRPQIGLIMEGLKAFEIPIYTQDGFEGDDIIGTISTQAKQNGYKTYILTGDKDSFQLVDMQGDICVLIPSKGELSYYGWDKVHEKMGIYPNQVVDYKALCGDTSDNIPGVFGIGAKTAVKLLEDYKTLDNIYKNLDETKGKLREKLETGREQAYLSQYLATIKTDMDIKFDFEKACINVPNRQNVLDFLQKAQFYNYIRSVDTILKWFAKDETKICKEDIVKFKEIKHDDGTQLGLFTPLNEEIQEDKFVEIDKDEFMNSLKDGDTVGFYAQYGEISIARGNKYANFTINEAKKVAASEKIKKVTYELKNTLHTIPVFKNVIDDVRLSAYIKDSTRKNDISTQLESYLSIISDENTKNGEFACYILKLHDFYMETLSEKERKILADIEIPLSYVLKNIEKTGVCLDLERLKELSDEIEQKSEILKKNIFKAAGMEFNIKSPKQVSNVLFEVLQIKPKKKNRSGYSTAANILEDLAQEHEIARDISEYRALMKLKNGYIDVLPWLVKDDGRVHTNFNQTTTATGRLSTNEPNLQSIPIKTELGNQIRGAFIAQNKENALIMSADYSQIELRLLAHTSGDENLIEAFKQGEDIHSATAAAIFGVDIKDVTKEMRQRAKAVNFGVVYGQTRFGLASSLGISQAQAQIFIDKYFEKYPKIAQYSNLMLTSAVQNGYVETLWGRRRYLGAELNSRNANIQNFAHRAAVNSPLQGSAADLIKIAMIDLDKKLKNFKSKIILQVHDELVLEVYREEFDEVKNLVRCAMEQGQPFKVPLKVDISAGRTWKEGE